MSRFLTETLNFDQAHAKLLYEGEEGGRQDMFLKGLFIQGDVRNHNNRVYPVTEISRAVDNIMEQIKRGESVLGECDHPDELTVHVDRVSHMITEMHMDGANGVGKMKILPTPCGQIVRTLLENGAKLGVSSRGSGNVDDSGKVSEFEIVTIDVVARPSAPGAYPQAVYEALNHKRNGMYVGDLAEAVKHDRAAQKYLKSGVLDWIKSLK